MAARATNLSNEFVKKGYNVDIVSMKSMVDESFIDIDENVNVVSLKKYNITNYTSKSLFDLKKRNKRIKILKRIHFFTKNIPKLDRKLSDIIMLIGKGNKLRNYLLTSKPDIIITLGLSYIESVISASKGLKCKIIYAEKNAPQVEFPEYNSDGFRYYIRLLKKVQAVVVQTKEAKHFFEGYLTNVVVINNPIKCNLPLPNKIVRNKNIVNFCRLSPQKNLEVLIDSFRKIHNEYPDFNLVIYGNVVDLSEKEYKQKIIEKVSSIELSDYIHILPAVADVHSRVLNCAMFVSSSDFEGLSNSVIEAMAIGLPCICTDCLGGGTREVIINEKNGLIVPTNDSEALYFAMKRFIDEPLFAEDCGRNAMNIRKKLSVERIVQQWIYVFGGL